MLHHQQTVAHSAFVTLTYEDKNMMVRNGVPNLVRSDVQKYFKRMRINELRLGRRPLIQYYLCGEYGDITARPHYHYILFGDIDVFGYPTEVRGKQIFAVAGNPVYDAWELGIVNVGYAEADSMRYVAQYIDKKLLGVSGYFSHVESPFQLSSQGLGIDWLKDNLEKVMYDAALSFRGGKYPLPRAYKDFITASFPAAADGISDRLIRQSIVADIDMMNDLVPETGGRSWQELTYTERSVVASRMFENANALSEVTTAEIKFRSRRQKI